MLDNANSDLNLEYELEPFNLLKKNELGQILLIYFYYACQLSVSSYKVCTFAPPSGHLINSHCFHDKENPSPR